MEDTIPIKKHRDDDYIITLDWTKETFSEFFVNRCKGMFATNGYKSCKREWIKSIKKGNQYEVTEFEENGDIYKIDGHNVEKSNDKGLDDLIRKWKDKYGFEINVLPKINNPQNTRMPDLIMIKNKTGENDIYELKTVNGLRKQATMDKLIESVDQANKVIINYTNPNYDIRNINRDIEEAFNSDNTSDINTIVLADQGEIKRVYKRITDTPLKTRRISVINKIPYKSNQVK